MIINSIVHSVSDLVIHQLKAYWTEIDVFSIRKAVPTALQMMDTNFKDINSSRFQVDGDARFNPLMSVHWMIFLYRLSSILFKNGGGTVANQVYYLNKIMHSIDWFYAIELPVHFLCEHPLGSVLGKATYGDYLLVYQGTTVGGSIRDNVLCYPKFGENVIMFANSSVIGKCQLGNNIILSAGTKVVNQNIPSNTIVFGESPNLIIKSRDEAIIKSSIEEYWR